MANELRTGILLMNTGTPDEPTEAAIACYLGEFLMDPDIIGAPYPIRKLIVNRICKTRPKTTVERYRDFWTEAGSPFMVASRSQRDKLQAELSARHAFPIQVALAMRYGNPSLESALDELHDAGCERIVIVPCYPQQANVITGTCLKAAHAAIKARAKRGWTPTVIDVASFWDQPAYQEVLAASVADAWHYQPGSKLIVSCHSTLLADIQAGDPYQKQVEATRDFLAAALNIAPDDALVAYQSRFDNRKWLQPSTVSVVKALAEEGVKDLCIVCPVFTAENLETAVEVNRNLRATFLEHAGPEARFTYVPCLNDSPGFIRALADAVEQALA